MIAKRYNHKLVEEKKYQYWLDNNLFKSGDLKKEPFCIVIPPPNITGKLHLGHAWDTTLQDIISRYKRMKGYDVLWLPGMDHAGIATQAKIDERLKDRGINPRSLSREEWYKYALDWQDEYAAFIREQWAKLGLSLDYSRERYTLDEGLSKAVTTAFVELYRKGYIYRGNKITNFDPEAMTALSNIEVIYKEVEGTFYYLKYRLVDSEEYLEVATTRPETIFGDTAVAVNPKDEKYQQYVGKKVIVPIANRVVPIITDDYVDMTFGTGVVKITPAHDPNDFEVGNRHNLERVVCMNKDATMNENAGEYEGLDRYECRKRLVEDLTKADLIVKTEKMKHMVGHSERTDVMVEPYLSEQWFVKMDQLAKNALLNQQDETNRINFIPKRFEKIFTNWLNNIQDWCISRQIHWGHRIPAWYKGDEIYVGYEAPKEDGWVQESDVLDTWFSSALWPFSTLGWPKEIDKRYFPTDVLVTGYDLIFFWVSRMIFQSLEFTKQKPFSDVLIHGLIRDKQGRKMSKSLGNGIDPMDVIEQYGADALRWYLTTAVSAGQDIRYDDEKQKTAWNFINKLWNASRFVLMNTEGFNDLNFDNLLLHDQWILTKLNETIKKVTKAMDKCQFNIVGDILHSFIWNDFCDWYIELSKASINEVSTKSVLIQVLTNILQMLHPFMPYVTEELYQHLKSDNISIMLISYPAVNDNWHFKESLKDMDTIIKIVQRVRNIKIHHNLKEYYLVSDISNPFMNKYQTLISQLLKKDIIDDDGINMEGMSTLTITLPTIELMVVFNHQVDIQEQIKKLNEEKLQLMRSIGHRHSLLTNGEFLNNAPSTVIEVERQKEKEETERLKMIEEQIDKLI